MALRQIALLRRYDLYGSGSVGDAGVSGHQKVLSTAYAQETVADMGIRKTEVILGLSSIAEIEV